MINFGAIIKKYREQLDVTQEELSGDLDITSTYISAIENGRKEPSLTLLKNICKELEIPEEVLVWEAVEVKDYLRGDDKKIVEMAKVIIKNYYENVTKPRVKT